MIITDKIEFINKVKGGLIVSCQALETEPLHSPYIMSKMAYAAKLGGAVGIRSNSVEDIIEIKKVVNLPIIGIIKKEYERSNVYITPTIDEVDKLVECGADVIATDATNRIRPNGITLEQFFKEVRKKYPNILFMADCSTFEEGIFASNIGFDFIGTTLSGYTEYSKASQLPNLDMMKRLVNETNTEIIGEGGIWYPEQLKQAMNTGILTAVVGTAITRPMEITKKFVEAIK